MRSAPIGTLPGLAPASCNATIDAPDPAGERPVTSQDEVRRLRDRAP